MTELELRQWLLREYLHLERELVEGEYPDLTISLSIARQTKQLPEYTKVKFLAGLSQRCTTSKK